VAHVITTPKFGLTMTEGTVSHWCKSVGEPVLAGEPLFEVQTDKITNEVESPQSGVLRHLFTEAGSVAEVGAPLAIIAEADKDISALLLEHGSPIAVSGPTETNTNVFEDQSGEQAVQPDDFILATPFARNQARVQHVDLTCVQGSGPNGIIVSRDVSAIPQAEVPAISPLAKKWAEEHKVDWADIRQSGRIMLPDVIAEHMRTLSSTDISPVAPRVQEMKGIRKVIASRMTQSWQQIPHVTLTREVDVTELKKAAELLRSETDGIKITLTHIFIKIVATALSETPALNAWCDGQSITYHPEVNMGVAVAVPDGLYVPVIRRACQKNVEAIAQEMADIMSRSRNHQLSPDDLIGGTFTISNLGMLGVDGFTPIINQPETGILGIGRVVDRPVFIGDQIEKRAMMAVSLSFDHRALDGADAARFLQKMEYYVEQPLRLLVKGR
jgi:pyruvate dehydrogenase E2 component (dihydrolipoamide acetyltransferase)